MNAAGNFVMTKASNSHNEQLTWFSEVASTISKSHLQQNAADGSSNLNTAENSSANVVHPSFPRNANNVRMFASTFQAERGRQVPSVTVPIEGGGATLYYSQAPRSTPYSNFFQANYSPTFSTTVSPVVLTTTSTTSALENQNQRSYLQVESYPSLIGVQSSNSALPCSANYLQPQHVSTAANISSATSLGHNRMYQQGRSILISRSPEGMIIQSPQDREPTHIRLRLSPNVSHSINDSSQPKLFATTDSVRISGSPSIENTLHDLTLMKEPALHRTSPSQIAYRMPTGKEGSLKHRILRPQSINIVEPPLSMISDAPLSAPPIRSHRVSSPKQVRSIPSSGYQSLSSSASSLTEMSNRAASCGASPNVFPKNCSSGSLSPLPPTSPTTAQLKYPQSFMKGAIIQLANNQLKQVEHMTTEDFIECGALSPTLKIDSSTVTSIEKNPATGAAKLGFQVGQNNIQITVEAPLEHPFFVYKQGWSSCCPERSAQRYKLECHKLKVGDTCISLTEKRSTTVNGENKTSNGCVPIINLTGSDQVKSTKTNRVGFEDASDGHKAACFPSKNPLPENINADNGTLAVRKRKRRWSAPDIPQNEETSSDV